MIKLFKITNLKRQAILVSALMFCIIAAYGQNSLQVKGVIVDGSNNPVENVSVGIEGSHDLPVIVDQNGEFTLETISGDIWLTIEPSIGFKSKRVYLNNRKEIKIFLTPNDVNSGDDYLSILAQGSYRKNVVAAFSTPAVNNIIETPVLSVDQYLQGRVPGMYTVNHSGDPAGGAVAFIRGINSINATNQPLYIVDGMPIVQHGVFQTIVDGYEYNPLLGVNPTDISKITVVKDPAVTAAYGSKASNGLVLIETLDPSATETVIEVDLRSGYSLAPSNFIPQMNAQQHKTLISELLFSSGLEEELLRGKYPNLFLNESSDNFVDYQHNTNWQERIFDDAAFRNLNVMVKGGDEIARYGLSVGYLKGNGIIKTTGYDGYNLRFVSMLNIFSWLKMNAGVSMNYMDYSMKESGRVNETSPIMTSLAKSPMLNPYQYDNENQLLNILAPVDNLGVSNPQAVLDNFEANNTNFNATTTLGFEAKLNKNMLINSKFGIGYNVLKEGLYMPNEGMELYYNNEAMNVAKSSDNNLKTIYNNTYFNYTKNFKQHTLSSTSGVNVQNNIFEYDWGLSKNAHPSDEYRRLQDGRNNLREIGGSNRTWNWLSFYERLNYSYKGKYLVTGSLSLDGSSRVGDNALNTIKLGGLPFGFFYSAGTAWRLSSESFLQDISALEELKIRLSYGRSGNDDVGESNSTKFYQAVKFRETTGLYPATFLNDELTYETVTQLNAGVDLGLWGNRLTAGIDVYKSHTDNMLMYTALEAYFGYDFRPENAGEMDNSGVDVSIFSRVIDMPDFKWDIQATYSTVHNQIAAIKGDKLVKQIGEIEIVNMPGEQANSFYGYKFNGVYTTSEEAESFGLVNDKLVPYQAGDAIFEDLSGPDGTPDGVINNYDKMVIGSSVPKHWGGIENTFTYKRWSLNAFVQFVTGNDIFNYVRYKNESMLGLENQSTTVLNRWMYEGQETSVPRALYDDLIGNSSFSTRWIEDGSYIRLKNVSLSYTIPNEVLVFKNAKFYVSASNVLTLSKYLGYDPEFSYSSSHVMQGIDYGLTPQARQFVIGIKLGL